MLICNNLSCQRNLQIIFKNLSINLKNYKILQIIGSNGIGKTSLLRILCGLLLIEENGIIKYSNINTIEKNFLFFLGNKQTLYKSMTPYDNLSILSNLIGNNIKKNDIFSALMYYGLQQYLYIPCKNLSTGQCQKVFLSQLLLLHDYKFFFLDEPFLYLDEQGIILTKRLIYNLICKNKNFIITTHSKIKDLTDVSAFLYL